MEKKRKKIIWIALAVLAVLVVGVVLYFRFMPVWASLQVLASLLVGLVAGWLACYAFGKRDGDDVKIEKNPVLEGASQESGPTTSLPKSGIKR